MCCGSLSPSPLHIDKFAKCHVQHHQCTRNQETMEISMEAADDTSGHFFTSFTSLFQIQQKIYKHCLYRDWRDNIENYLCANVRNLGRTFSCTQKFHVSIQTIEAGGNKCLWDPGIIASCILFHWKRMADVGGWKGYRIIKDWWTCHAQLKMQNYDWTIAFRRKCLEDIKTITAPQQDLLKP